MIRKLLFLTTLFVFLIATTNLFAGVPNASNKLVYFRQFNTFTSSYPVSQSALNFNSSLVSSATIDYGGSGISPINFPRTNWDITNASSTLDPATAPYVEYTINFNSSVNIDLDRFVITGGGSNYSTKFELRWSKDNYATRLGLFSFGSDWQYKLSSVNLNTLSNFVGTQLKFRLYFYDTSPSGFNFVHSDTGPNPSLDGTPSSYDIWTATATVWVNPPPAINTITPSTGAIGSTVVINGTDFTGATTLSFNGTNATNFTVDSPTQITATVPVGTTTGPITVTTPNGTGTSATNFTISSPTITTTGTNAITSLTACVNTLSAAQTFTVSGSDLTQNIVITSSDPTNIEFSLTGNSSSYSDTLTLTPTTGTVTSKTVYIRQKSSATVGSNSRTVSIASTGATPTTFSLTSTIGIPTAITNHPTTSSRWYCQNSTSPPTFSVTATGSGLTYQWYSKTERGNPSLPTGGTLIPGATSSTYTADISSISFLYYYCVVTGTCSTKTSNLSGSIDVRTPPIAGTATASTSAVCSNSTTTISLSGHSGYSSIRWYKSSNNFTTYSLIDSNLPGQGSGATTDTYTTPALTTTMYYRAEVIQQPCYIPSTVASVVITPATVAGTATPTATAVCPGSTTTITLTLTGNLAYTIQWQQSTDGATGWVDVIGGSGATTATYTTPAITGAIYYRASVTSNSCVSYSTVASVALNAITVQPSATAQNVCINGITASLSVTATGAGLTYQWYKNTTATNIGGTLISGATNSVFMPLNTLVGTTYYYCVVSDSCSSQVTSSVSGAITVTPVSESGSITGTASICSGTSTSVTLSGNVGAVQWQRFDSPIWTDVTGETNTTFTTPALSQNTSYRAVVTSGLCTAANTASFNVTVNPLPVISGNTTVGIGDAITLTATTTAASSNAWVSSNPTKASVSNLGVVNGWISGTTTITYTNNNGCTDTESITVTAGTTQSPSLSFPATNSMAASTLNFNYSLPEIPLANSVQLVFVPTGGGTPIVWIMNNDTSASFSYGVGTNPTSIPNVLSGTVLGFTTYTVTLSYQDAFGNSPSSVTNTNIQIVEAPSISIANNSYTGFVNSALTPISVTSNGGAVSSYAISPSLPSGLILNSTTGAITGTPTAILASTTFILSATNPAGTVSVTFSLLIDMDTDGDGVPDSVETQQGTNPNLASSYLDTDTDGVPNYIELQQGTNPNVASSYLDTDSDGLSDYYEANNHAPTNSSITTTTISENNSVGDVIGNLSTTDADAGDTHSYTLVSGTGSTDNANFSIVGNELRAGIAFDFETKSTYSIRIKTTDAGGLTFEKVFTVAVTNVNETPVLSVSQTSYFGVVASPLTIITVTNTGGTATSFAIIPALPSGLFFDTTTGTISGTPTVALVATNFTITATNSAGTASVQFSLLIDIDATNQIVDTDGDGVPDTIDTEDDGDGIIDGNDAFPFDRNEWTDSDSDGTGDNADTDDDNDGVLDTCDVDTNGDGIPDNGIDLDGDGIIDSCDSDMDGDGVNNTSDNCPLLPNINQADRDRDGQGDVCDTIELNISEAITPNGDGINDTWVIYNLNNHPGSTVRVFDTNGVQVFYSANYQNNWAGNYEGKNEMLPVGSYLFQIDLGSDGSKDYQGWLYITK